MDKKPNIVFILTDDQGAWAMGCAGNTDIFTPNLDRLAQSGYRFDNFFCSSPVCSPARATIMTGRIPSQHGVHDWIRSGNFNKEDLGEMRDDAYYVCEKKAIPYLAGMKTYTDVLNENHYNCALSGKWHLGDSLHPQHGFQKWFTIGRGGCFYYKPDMVENGKVYYEDRYVTNLITDKAISYIDEMKDEENPFYISVHYTAPHDPWSKEDHPARFWDLYNDCEFKATPDLPIHKNQVPSAHSGTGEVRKSILHGYYTAVSAMDAGVGKILDKLEQENLLENTIVIFMADNGMNMGHHGIWGKGNGTFPINMFDTAVKVPFIVSWPGVIPQNRTTQSMHSQYDFMQTLLDLAGIDAQLPENLPGKSFKNVLLTGCDNDDESIVIYDEYGPNRMIRSREWKLIHRYPYGPDELYHLSEDPDEDVNLIDDQNYEEIRASMMDRLNQWFTKYADPRLDGAKEGVYGFGQMGLAGCYSEGQKTYMGIPSKKI